MEVLGQSGGFQYLRDRVHEGWLPDGARQQLRGLSRGFKCKYTSPANTATRVNHHERKLARANNRELPNEPFNPRRFRRLCVLQRTFAEG